MLNILLFDEKNWFKGRYNLLEYKSIKYKKLKSLSHSISTQICSFGGLYSLISAWLAYITDQKTIYIVEWYPYNVYWIHIRQWKTSTLVWTNLRRHEVVNDVLLGWNPTIFNKFEVKMD